METFRLIDASGDFLIDGDGNYLVWSVGIAATGVISLAVAAPTITLTPSED